MTVSIRRPFQPLADGDPSQVGRYQLLARLGAGGFGTVYLSLLYLEAYKETFVQASLMVGYSPLNFAYEQARDQ